MKLILLHGTPGVGKLTVGKELQKISGYKLFHNHLVVDLVLSLFEFGSPGFVRLREEIWLNSFNEAAESELEGLIFTFAMEATVPDDFIDKLVKTISDANGEVFFAGLSSDEAILKNRIESPERAKFGKINSWDFYKKIKELGGLVPLTPPPNQPHILIDTTFLSAQQTAEKVWQSFLSHRDMKP